MDQKHLVEMVSLFNVISWFISAYAATGGTNDKNDLQKFRLYCSGILLERFLIRNQNSNKIKLHNHGIHLHN